MSGRCLLKWFHLPTLPPNAAASPSCDVLTLRLGVIAVNTAPQYIVDIASGTQDIAPVLQQMSKSVAIFGKWRESSRAVEILAGNGPVGLLFCSASFCAVILRPSFGRRISRDVSD